MNMQNTPNNNHIVLKQDPVALIQNLKSLAYTLKDALSDIIDNSIKAKADKIWIYAPPDQTSISIIDNGYGMSKKILTEAMSVFNVDPRILRSDEDLGRFGMGLKTASLSKCNKFTVASKNIDGETSALTFDVQYIEKNELDDLVAINRRPEEIKDFDLIGKQGTLVLWENLNIASGNEKTEINYESYNDELVTARNHISLIFHRFLEGETLFNSSKLEIYWNNDLIEPFNPFNPTNLATQKVGPNTYEIKNSNNTNSIMTLEAFTLPEQSKVSSDIWKYYSGPQHSLDIEGYLDNQGFYVYRLKRLIAYGSKIKNWLGLLAPRPISQLARVKVDIDNSLDEEWGIELKKADLQPNYIIKQHLKTMIPNITKQSTRIYQNKGIRLSNKDNPLEIWELTKAKGEFKITIDTDSPIIAKFMEELNEYELLDRFEEIVSALEASIPYSYIYSTMVDNKPLDHTEEELLAWGTLFLKSYDGNKNEMFWEILFQSFKSKSNTDIANKLIEILKKQSEEL